MGCIESVCLHQLGRSSGLAETILAVDEFYGCGCGYGQSCCNSLSETSGKVVLLGDNCATGLAY